MIRGETLKDYSEEVGGVFSQEEIEAIPYNHWKKDCEWMVLVSKAERHLFVPVSALTAREACDIAIQFFKLLEDPDDDEQ